MGEELFSRCLVCSRYKQKYFLDGQTIAKGFKFPASGSECYFTKNEVIFRKSMYTMHGLYALKMRVRCPDVAAEVCVASTENFLQL